ncbi:hypothetical protein [Streptococcus porci]|uniref:hypothetical protein n=1 Tax=Streptococcus porci TaxID=502567 RepID=UPI0004186B4F|nr:hypothetical protein [Streptococcus porci]
MVYRKKEYALYKGDKLIGIGTQDELAALIGVKSKTIHYYGTPTYQKRTNPAKAKRLVRLDDET